MTPWAQPYCLVRVSAMPSAIDNIPTKHDHCLMQNFGLQSSSVLHEAADAQLERWTRGKSLIAGEERPGL